MIQGNKSLKGVVDMKNQNIMSYPFLIAAFIFALCNSIYCTDYVSNAAKAIIVPLFLIAIVDFLGKIRDRASQILNNKISISHADYREAKANYQFIAKLEHVDTQGKVQGWKNIMEESENCCIQYHLIDIEIEKMFKWYFPVYVLLLAFLILSFFLAQLESWLALLSKMNSDTITLWTFTLLLLDISLTDILANKLIIFAEKRNEKKLKKV